MYNVQVHVCRKYVHVHTEQVCMYMQQLIHAKFRLSTRWKHVPSHTGPQPEQIYHPVKALMKQEDSMQGI